VVKTILYITRDYKYSIGQEAVETYYQHNINRLRRIVKKRVGEIEYHGSDGMFYVTDVYAYVDDLQPGRLLQFIKTALRTEGFHGTQIFERYYSVAEIVTLYLRALRQRVEVSPVELDAAGAVRDTLGKALETKQGAGKVVLQFDEIFGLLVTGDRFTHCDRFSVPLHCVFE
jgi:hypothetical protein